MITGHCTADAHDRCPAPSRCSCPCHPHPDPPPTTHRRPPPADEAHRCPHCPVSYRDPIGLAHHLATVHPPGDATVAVDRCPTCRAVFRSPQGRGAHYRHHPDHRPGASGTAPSSEATKPEARRRDAGTVELPVAERTIDGHTLRLVIVAPAELQPIVELFALAHNIDLTGK